MLKHAHRASPVEELYRTPHLLDFAGMRPFAGVGHPRTVSSPESENIPSRAVRAGGARWMLRRPPYGSDRSKRTTSAANATAGPNAGTAAAIWHSATHLQSPVAW